MAAVIIAQYLDFSEVTALKKELDSAQLEYAVQRHGLPIFLGAAYATYRISVKKELAEQARSIAVAFIDNLKKNRADFEAKLLVQCPVCDATDIYVLPKKWPWQKFYYFGVVVHRCKQCNSEWYT